ncbi:AbgT family transporter [Haliangium sp.]|uniref:AbgT family transporter n=1 Tax=Haliangium sp. TaxID=2663208 RepID=UPI003D0B2A4C
MANSKHGILDTIERLGNRMPAPASLFAGALLAVMLVSELAVRLDWSVSKQVMVNGQLQRVQVQAISLLSSEGLYWLISNVVDNFGRFPALGVTLVAMLGIGVAERTGFLAAFLKVTLFRTPQPLLVPATIFVGVMSSLAIDAGFVVLPPIAAYLFHRAGRPAVVGVAAVYAGVAGGFGANLFITGIDPMLASLTQDGARTIVPGYQVAVTCNWWFAIASTILLTVTGWLVSHFWIEPAYRTQASGDDGEHDAGAAQSLTRREKKALAVAAIVFALLVAAVWILTVVPGSPLYGKQPVPEGADPSRAFDRWVVAIVPLLLVVFLVTGVVYGVVNGTVRGDKDVDKMMSDTMASLGSIIVLIFFAAQFIVAFNHSRLGELMAVSAGQFLAEQAMSPYLLLVAFILMVVVSDLMVGSMSAKYALFAPIFIPIFMQGASISPELVQAAYRVGDSVTNTITPLNPFLAVVLVYIRQHVPRAGLGTVIAVMLPYTLAFLVVWTAMLLAWMWLGADLGPGGPVFYSP